MGMGETSPAEQTWAEQEEEGKNKINVSAAGKRKKCHPRQKLLATLSC